MGNYHINEGTNLPDLAKYSYSYTTSEILTNEDIKAALAPSKLRLQSYLQEGGVIDAVDIDWQYSGIKINNTYVESTGHLAYLIGNISQSVDFPEEWGIRWINIPLYKYTNDGNDYKPFVDENNSTDITYFQYATEDNNYWTFTKNANATEKYTYISSYTAGFDSLNNFKRWSDPVSDVDKVVNNIYKNITLYNTTSDSSVETPFINSSNVTNINYFDIGSSENNGWSISKNTAGTNGDGVGTNVWMSSYTQILNANDVFIKWTEPVTIPFKLNGEHGQSAPTEYYEARYYASANKPNAPTNSDGYVPDNDDVNLPWKLIPVNNDPNKVIWQTQRRVLCTIENNDIVKEYNGNWSDPIQWTGTNGTPGDDAPKIVMVYQRTNDGVNAPNRPASSSPIISIAANGSQGDWAESPGNSAENYKYLWMTSAHYTQRMEMFGQSSVKYTLADTWQTPVCLTGEDGEDGKDGTDIEFIYFRTNDENKTFDNNWDNFEGDSTENDWPFVGTVGTDYFIIDGIKTLKNQNHDTWTDNPFGVTHEYNYEYCAIRKKINNTWQSFCKPFNWSKYGEDGIDGDGVEYIFYLSPDENEVTFGDPTSQNPNNNPASWDANQDPEYVHVDYKYPTHNPGWSDDPRGVSIHNKYEYVSIRHKRLNTTTNEMEWGEYSEPALWARFAEDGRAISLVLESNNDMTSISINSNHIVNDLVETDTIFSLYHNTSLVDLSSTQYYNMEIFSCNGNANDGYYTGYDEDHEYSYLKHNNDIIARLKSNSLNNNSYEMHISIPEGFDMSDINDELRIYSKATIIDSSFDANNDVEVGTEKLITTKVKGLQLSLDDIFQIWADRAVLKDDGTGSYPISINLQSLTSNTKIITAQAQNENKLYIVEDNNNGSKKLINVGLQEYENVENSYTYKLYYYDSDSNVTEPIISQSGTFLDEETVSLVKSNETYQLIVFPQVINCSTIRQGDKITVNVLKYCENIITNITNDLGDYDLSVKYRLVPNSETGNPTYITLIDENTVDIPSLNINTATTKAVEFILVKNNETIWTQTISLIKNGEDPIYPITCELLNDNWQLAVSKDKMTVLANNRQNSYLRIYYGTTDITGLISNFTLTAINAPEFWIVQDRGGTINIDSNNNPITINLNVASAIQLSSALNSQQNIKLKISFTYLGIRYEREINLSYVPLPQDGENAELYEIFIENDTIKQQVLEDTIVYDVMPIVKVRHIFGEESELLNIQDLTDYFVFYKVDDNNWRQTANGTISLPNEEINNIVVRLFNVPINEINEFYSNFIDQENIVVLRDGINGTDSFAEEFIYYCPEGNTEIDWNNISDTTLDPSTWDRSTSPDYIENNAWQDHPTGIDETHQYEYVAHRTWDKENEIWNNYSSPMIWSKWGHTGRDGDGVEYIYYLNDSETFDGLDPTNWTSDENFQNTEYINTDAVVNYEGYNTQYFTTEAVEDGITVTLTVGTNVGNRLSSIQYSVNDGRTWTKITDFSRPISVTLINIGDKILWKGEGAGTGTATNVNTAEYFSVFTASGQFIVYGNILSLIYKDDFEYIKTLESNSTFRGLFYNSTNLIDAQNLVLSATDISAGYKTYSLMFEGCTNLINGPKYLPAKSIGTFCYQNMFYNCTSLQYGPAILFEGTPPARAYNQLFRSCNNLKEIKIYSTYTSENNVYTYWISGYFQVSNDFDVSIYKFYYFDDSWANLPTEYDNGCSIPIYAYNWQGPYYTWNKIKILSWTDNPSGVSETYKYEWVSTRKYKVVTFEDTELIAAGLSVGSKAWHPYSDPTIWASYGESGSFISTVFKRNATAPATPNGGSYDNPVPNGWSDGIPTGSGPIWASTGIFKPGDNNGPTGGTTQGWSTPQLMADTNIYDVEFSAADNPGDPDNNPLNWHDPTTDTEFNYSTSIWRAERTKTPGTNTWGSWVITRIKGEQGDPGTGTFELDWTNDQVNFGVDSTGKSNSGYKTTILNLITTDTSNSLRINNIVYDTSNGSSVNPSNSAFVTTQLANHTTTPGNGKIGWCYYFNNNKHYIYIRINEATIPQNGIDVTFAVDIYKNDSHLCWVTKTLRIFGQRNGQNGVSYELAISPNAISLASNGMLLNPTFNIGVIKYDGDTITNLTTLPDVLSIQYSVGPSSVGSSSRKTASIGNDVTIEASGSNDIVFYLVTNDGANTFDIDVETIPVVRDGSSGGTGPQGFSGPVVRYCGEYDEEKVYLTGKYYTGTNSSFQYNGTDVLYKDIVYHKTNKKYYTPKQTGTGTTNYYSSANSTTGGCKGAGYLPANSEFIDENWTEAKQFDFVATKLLYADQALVNQLTTHELIATKSNGYPVAGITSGSKAQGQNGALMSSLDPNNNSTITSQVYASEDISAEVNNPSNVRIFAGDIYDSGENSYSLTYAPFNVRQDGTAYMSKANIVGNVNIGGNVDISGNVNIHGNNVRIDGDLYANTLALSTNSFYYNEYRMLPDFNENEIKMHQLMFYGAPNTISYLIPQPDTYLLMINTNGLTSTNCGGDTAYVNDKALYTLYSKYGDISSINSNITGEQKFWLVTKTNLCEKINDDAPATISSTISISISNVSVNTNTGIVTVTFSKGATPSVSRYGHTYSALRGWSYHLAFNYQHYWRQKIKGKYMRPGDSDPDDSGISPDDIILGTVMSDYEYAEYYGNVPPGTSVVTQNMAACAAPQVSGDTQGGVMRWHTHHGGTVYSWAEVTSIDKSLLSCTGKCILARIN